MQEKEVLNNKLSDKNSELSNRDMELSQLKQQLHEKGKSACNTN